MIAYFAQLGSLFAQTSSRVEEVRQLVVYELGRLANFDDPRVLWITVGGAFVLLACFVAWFYHRERDALRGSWRGLLISLRIVAFAALVLYFLSLEKRVDQQIVTDSQVVVLVDTSQSMSVEDETSPKQAKISRSEAVRQVLTESSLLAQLQLEHNVVLAVFDEKLNRVMRWERISVPPDHAKPQAVVTEWLELLEPQGGETRLGSALRALLDEESGGPLAGVIVLSDGGQNSGAEPLEIADMAGVRQTPFYTVGVGSTKPRRNIRVQELNAPARVYLIRPR